MSAYAIELEQVTKWYGPVIGLAGFEAKIGVGVHALLGPNGAGKSTLFKCLGGLVRPDRGRVRVLGEDPFANPALYRRIGLCPELDPFPERMVGRTWLERIARFAGYGPSEARSRTEAALETVGMRGDGAKRLGGMSKGMRQRMKLAQAILHDPEVLLLDEPFNGLDPVQRKAVIDLVRGLGTSGRAVLLASHVLHEVESITDRILLLREGKLLAEGTIKELRDHFADIPRRLSLRVEEPRRAAAALLELEGTEGVRLLGGDRLEVSTRRADHLLDWLTRAAASGELALREITPEDEDLSSVFGMLEG
ncbi:MAG: ABC transporter ATP-binding protein [Planctomycetes bacterium]|nr:ABC transporter ATP-binding protein [Planctomycetota bacterium]